MGKNISIKKGMKIQAPSMLLMVTEAKGKWVRCNYWDKSCGAWKERGCTESRAKLEAGLADGHLKLV